ncbi:MAG: adenosylcobinamide-GDP ribazoletransferase [Bariatricus sp.]
MNWIQSLIIAFSMYSRLPMPVIEWNEKNMKYAMCFFPLIGVVTGGMQYLVGSVMYHAAVGRILFAAVMTLIPVVISGGIHLDGFMDTMDALGSCGDRQKKLEILKDSHSGAFAVMGMGCYLVWSLGIWSELTEEMLAPAACIYVISRALSGYSVVTFPAAKDSGLARTFQDGAQKKAVQITSALWLLAGAALMLWADVWAAMGAAIGALCSWVYYRRICRKQFGGVTGDLAGFFLQVSELAMLTGMVVMQAWK